ncbi:MAG: hypothetical protein JWN98_1514 [Abditibacteriota bacterium]|nr:hypothetical protein [Abditibacteriota bacterium]
MVNNQPADEQAAHFSTAAGPTAAGKSIADSETEANRASSQTDKNTALHHLALDEAAPMGAVQEASSGTGQDATLPASLPTMGSGSFSHAISHTEQRGLVAGSDRHAVRNEPRASVQPAVGTQAVGVQYMTSSLPPWDRAARRPTSSATHPALATDDGQLLGVRPMVRLMLVSDSAETPAKLSALQEFCDRVVELGHVLEVATSNDWQRLLADMPPEVIVFAANPESSNIDMSDEAANVAQQHTCRALKHHAEAAGCLLAVLLIQPQSTLDAATWQAWQSAGADVIVESTISPPLLQSNLEVWARLVRLQRDANMLRDTLGKQVQFDDLTQLLNRRFFFRAAHGEVSRARRYNHALACLMIDINHFKLYNKTFGYACGDHILRTVAATIRSWTRECDIVARFGAKKFVVLLPETDVNGAMMLHEKLQHEISDFAFVWEGQTLPLTISIGEAERRREMGSDASSAQHALTPEDELRLGSEGDESTPLSIREELADLLEDADAALYVAKKGVRYPSFPINPNHGDEVSGILGAA